MSRVSNAFCQQLEVGYEKSACSDSDGLLLAVSGGADSIALLHGTLQIRPRKRDRMVVAHVDHSLREQSRADAEFVARLAAQLGIRCEVHTLHAGNVDARNEGSIEEAARKARYEFLETTAGKLGLNCVVTAHHMDDQAETVLHNILRGTGLRGLRGMQAGRSLSNSIRLVRPMLEIRRSDILEFLADAGNDYRTDSSNQELTYTRNRIRHQLLPVLKSDFNESVDRSLLSLATQAGQTLGILDALAEKILKEAVLDRQPDVCRLDRCELNKWPTELIQHVLSVLWIQQQWPRQKMTFRQYSRLATAIADLPDCRLDLPGGLVFQATMSAIRFTVRQSPASDDRTH